MVLLFILYGMMCRVKIHPFHKVCIHLMERMMKPSTNRKNLD